MPSIDLSSLPRVEVVRVSKTFTDPRCPGVDFPFEFGFMPFASEVDILFLSDRSQELIKKYVKGNLPVVVPGGARVPIEKTTCWLVSAFMQAEQATGTESVWSAEEWFRFSILAPSAWADAQKWYLAEERKAQGLPDAPDEDDDEPEAAAPPNV